MGGGVPASTTSTTTVNQSPWQNPTYQALMLGTQNNPGPVTNILRSNAGMMNAYNNLLAQGVTPMDVVRSNQFNPTAGGAGTSFQPTQKAAEGGIMGVRKFASGSSTAPKDISSGQANHLAQLQKRVDANKPLSASDQNVYNYLTQTRQAYTDYQNQQQTQTDNTATAQQGLLDQSMGQTAFTRVNPQTGALESTNPLFNQAVGEIQQAQQLPSQFGQATNAYNQALSGLQGMTNYTPQQVQAMQEQAAQYQASLMNAPADISAQSYDAAQAQAAQMNQPQDVQAVRTRAAQMQGPQSWNAPGTVQQYMDPYIQSVIASQQGLANRQFAQQQNQLRSQATGQHAFGGARETLAEQNAQLNQNIANQNLAAQGLSNAYTTGLGQFNTAQGQGLQAGQANLSAAMQANLANQQAGMTAQQLNQAAGLTTGQANLSAAQQTALANQNALNTQRSQYVTQALQAAQTNYGGQLTAAQQNQVAQNAAAQFNAKSQNQINLANQQASLQAGLANQSAGLQANQQNLGAYGQMLTGAGGLGSLGASQASTNLANIGALGQGASAWQNLGQQYLNTQTQNAQNAINFPSSLYSGALNAINAQPSTGGTNTAFGTSTPASPFGKAHGGEVEAHKEWDKAKGGKTVKKGIASKGWN